MYLDKKWLVQQKFVQTLKNDTQGSKVLRYENCQMLFCQDSAVTLTEI